MNDPRPHLIDIRAKLHGLTFVVAYLLGREARRSNAPLEKLLESAAIAIESSAIELEVSEEEKQLYAARAVDHLDHLFSLASQFRDRKV